VQTIEKRHNRGKDFSIVVVAEGVMLQAEEKDDEFVVQEAGLDEFGHVKLGGIGQVICNEVEQRTGFETRVTVLGHLQRGGTPTAFDRVLGTRFGIAAIDLVHAENFGNMVSLQGNEIVSIPLSEAVDKLKVVDQDFYDLARVFFG
jgi:6-phosphofructokinase 1